MVRWFILAGLASFTGLSTLGAQCVQFDVIHSVPAHDVSTPEFQTTSPGEKLICIKLPISSFIQSDESQLQLLYFISGTTKQRFQVVDYAPKTILITDVDGVVSSEVSEDDSTSIGIQALAPGELPVRGDASAKVNRGTRRLERQARLPQKHLLAASGTMHRGLSAYFKLNPSTQTTLEGDHLFEITARVKSSWRASLLHIHCVALKTSEGADWTGTACNQQDFIVGAFLAGDEQAKACIEGFTTAQIELVQLARTLAQSVEERRYPSFPHKLGAAISVVKPKIPDDWMSDLLSSGDFHPFERHLPRPIQTAATQYRQARAAVLDLAR